MNSNRVSEVLVPLPCLIAALMMRAGFLRAAGAIALLPIDQFNPKENSHAN